MRAWLAKHAEIATNATVVIGALAAGIALFGGSIPPWAPAPEFEVLRMNVDGIIAERDATRCDDWNRRLSNAVARISLDRDSLVDLDIVQTSRQEIRRIPNCKER